MTKVLIDGSIPWLMAKTDTLLVRFLEGSLWLKTDCDNLFGHLSPLKLQQLQPLLLAHVNQTLKEYGYDTITFPSSGTVTLPGTPFARMLAGLSVLVRDLKDPDDIAEFAQHWLDYRLHNQIFLRPGLLAWERELYRMQIKGTFGRDTNRGYLPYPTIFDAVMEAYPRAFYEGLLHHELIVSWRQIRSGLGSAAYVKIAVGEDDHVIGPLLSTNPIDGSMLHPDRPDLQLAVLDALTEFANLDPDWLLPQLQCSTHELLSLHGWLNHAYEYVGQEPATLLGTQADRRHGSFY